MRRKADTLLPIEVAILRAGLALRSEGEPEFHGYAVAKRIAEAGESRRLTAHGTLYRALDRLEQRKLVESRLEEADIAATERRPRRRLYAVTALGEKSAQAAAAERGPVVSPERGMAAP